MIRLLIPLLREALALMVARAEAKAAIRRLAVAFGLYAFAALFALTAFGFLNVELYLQIAARLDDQSAAAILFGVYFLLVVLLILVRWINARGHAHAPATIADDLERLAGPDLEKLAAVGRRAEKSFRAAAPEIALGAVVVGLILGRFPGLLHIFDSGRRGDRRRR